MAAETDWWANAVTRIVCARITIELVPLSSSGGLLKATSTASPTTTDGTATGSMNRASRVRFPRRFSPAAASAAQVPTVSASRLATRAVTSEVVSARRDSPCTAEA